MRQWITEVSMGASAFRKAFGKRSDTSLSKCQWVSRSVNELGVVSMGRLKRL